MIQIECVISELIEVGCDARLMTRHKLRLSLVGMVACTSVLVFAYVESPRNELPSGMITEYQSVVR